MEFSLHFPRPPLARFVESITWYAGFDPTHLREKLVPDGAIQIIVDLTETPKKLYADEMSDRAVDFRKAWISGMHTRPIVIEAQPAASMLVIRFRSGGAHAFLGLPADALTGDVFALGDVIGRTASSLRDRILEAPDAASKAAAAEAWLWEQHRAPDLNALVEHVATRLQKPAGLTIKSLVEETGYSARQVQNLFRQWVGLSPKQYARVRRFNQLIAELCRAGAYDPALGGKALPAPDWAALAAELRYADQSHLVNEFRTFAGMTPGAYVAAYRGLENYLPIGQR